MIFRPEYNVNQMNTTNHGGITVRTLYVGSEHLAVAAVIEFWML